MKYFLIGLFLVFNEAYAYNCFVKKNNKLEVDKECKCVTELNCYRPEFSGDHYEKNLFSKKILAKEKRERIERLVDKAKKQTINLVRERSKGKANREALEKARKELAKTNSELSKLKSEIEMKGQKVFAAIKKALGSSADRTVSVKEVPEVALEKEKLQVPVKELLKEPLLEKIAKKPKVVAPKVPAHLVGVDKKRLNIGLKNKHHFKQKSYDSIFEAMDKLYYRNVYPQLYLNEDF